jgi:hypothetical protein
MKAMVFERLRGRLPVILFVVVVALCLVLVAFACSCLVADHSKQSLTTAFTAAGAPAVTDAWPLLVLSLVAAGMVERIRRNEQRSVASLQRFLC